MGARHNDIAERIARGEESGFVDFGIRYRRGFYALFRNLGIHDAAARDLVCNCLTDIPLKVKASFKLGSNFDAWVYTSARNTGLSWLRAERPAGMDPLPPDLPDDSRDSGPPAPRAADVAAALRELETLDREILHLRYDGSETPTFGEIAADLVREGQDISEDTVRQRHKRALKKIRDILQRLKPEE